MTKKRLVKKDGNWEVAVRYERDSCEHPLEGESISSQTDAQPLRFEEKLVVRGWNYEYAREKVKRALQKRYGSLLRFVSFDNTHEYRGLHPLEKSLVLPFFRPRYY